MIQKVKTSKNGYIIFYNNSEIWNVAPDNEEVKQWLAEGNTPEPEFTDEEIAEQELQVKLQEAQAYLNNTDWYYARKAETGEDVPVEVVEKRLASRELIRGAK